MAFLTNIALGVVGLIVVWLIFMGIFNVIGWGVPSVSWHAPAPPTSNHTVLPQTADCAAKGGTRVINPSTGRPSCYVPNR